MMKMDGSYENHAVGRLLTIVSLLSASVSLSEAYDWVKLIGSIVAIISGIFAIRYYYFATNKIKKND
jgi:hypothetical protein